MVKFSIKLYIGLFISILILPACTRNDAASVYIKHTNRIYRLIKENKHNTDLAGKAILEYVTTNKDAIEASLKSLNALTVKQTTDYYNQVMMPVNRIKALLQAPQVIYPDAIRKEIMKLLAENQGIIDEQTEQLKQSSSYFLKTHFTRPAAMLTLIKQLVAESAVDNFKLANNPDFIAAAELMRFSNLVLP